MSDLASKTVANPPAPLVTVIPPPTVLLNTAALSASSVEYLAVILKESVEIFLAAPSVVMAKFHEGVSPRNMFKLMGASWAISSYIFFDSKDILAVEVLRSLW